MVSKRGLSLTPAGVCCNPDCRAPLFKELMLAPDDDACLDCNPPCEGVPTAFRKIMGHSDGCEAQELAAFLAALPLTPVAPSRGVCLADCCRPPVAERPLCSEACCADERDRRMRESF